MVISNLKQLTTGQLRGSYRGVNANK